MNVSTSRPVRLVSLLSSLLGLVLALGCQAPATAPVAVVQEAAKLPAVQTIREGDVLKISFPGAVNLDTTVQVRTDGHINLTVVGDVKAAGLTPSDLEGVLREGFKKELNSADVIVTLVSSSFDVYVSGAVMRPGKITTSRPITAFQAIMEAGGFDPARANTRKVLVIREEGHAKYSYFTLDMQPILQGQQGEPFYLKPSDTVQVPERFSMF